MSEKKSSDDFVDGYKLFNSIADYLHPVAARAIPLFGERRNALGLEIRRLREEHGWTQLQMVAKMQRAGWNCASDTLSRIESGFRTLTDLELIFLLKILRRKFGDLRIPPNP